MHWLHTYIYIIYTYIYIHIHIYIYTYTFWQPSEKMVFSNIRSSEILVTVNELGTKYFGHPTPPENWNVPWKLLVGSDDSFPWGAICAYLFGLGALALRFRRSIRSALLEEIHREKNRSEKQWESFVKPSTTPNFNRNWAVIKNAGWLSSTRDDSYYPIIYKGLWGFLCINQQKWNLIRLWLINFPPPQIHKGFENRLPYWGKPTGFHKPCYYKGGPRVSQAERDRWNHQITKRTTPNELMRKKLGTTPHPACNRHLFSRFRMHVHVRSGCNDTNWLALLRITNEFLPVYPGCDRHHQDCSIWIHF